MDPDLATAITLFRRAQDCAVHILTNQLKLPRPNNVHEWIFICDSRGLYDFPELYTLLFGYEIYAHGNGIELAFQDFVIDFDWGCQGEPDGFDDWRLWRFLMLNQLPSPDTKFELEQIRSALIQAHTQGYLIKPEQSSLYYWPADRAQ